MALVNGTKSLPYIEDNNSLSLFKSTLNKLFTLNLQIFYPSILFLYVLMPNNLLNIGYNKLPNYQLKVETIFTPQEIRQ